MFSICCVSTSPPAGLALPDVLLSSVLTAETETFDVVVAGLGIASGCAALEAARSRGSGAAARARRRPRGHLADVTQDGAGYCSGTQLGEGSFFGRRAGAAAAVARVPAP